MRPIYATPGRRVAGPHRSGRSADERGRTGPRGRDTAWFARAGAGVQNGRPMAHESLDTHEKTTQINRDTSRYGTFAEIGAGQEVARWFFRVGGAAGTVAKTISAYDMQVSDAIYGGAQRYVSRNRLQTMLDYEFRLLLERLDGKRGDTTGFFVFADTVAATSWSRKGDPNGWVGIRFQHVPRAEPSEIIIHVRMLDRENLQQQEALGIMGVNLLWGAFHLANRPTDLIRSLLDDLTRDRVEVDMVRCDGPAFADVDNRLLALELVRNDLAHAVMFRADGETVQASEVLYQRPVLIERGRFRPVTRVTHDMLEKALAQFVRSDDVAHADVAVLMEMTLRNLTAGAAIDTQDFLDRVDLLGALGRGVLISNYFEYYRLAAYLYRYTHSRIGIVMGVPSLREVFVEKYYTHLDGGILEAFGRMFKSDLRLYVYPFLDPETGTLVTAEDFEVAPNLRHLYAHLVQNGFIEPVRDFDRAALPIRSRDVLARLRAGDPAWAEMVPGEVAQRIRERRLFGFRG